MSPKNRAAVEAAFAFVLELEELRDVERDVRTEAERWWCAMRSADVRSQLFSDGQPDDPDNESRVIDLDAN